MEWHWNCLSDMLRYIGVVFVVVDAQPFPHDKCNLFARADETNVNELTRNGKTRSSDLIKIFY